jgi:hypothetical protein
MNDLPQQPVLNLLEAGPLSVKSTNNKSCDSESKESDTVSPQESRVATSDKEEAPVPQYISESASEFDGGLQLKKGQIKAKKKRS